eukprot:57772-Chlamydomonas_euryale.AAC.4
MPPLDGARLGTETFGDCLGTASSTGRPTPEGLLRDVRTMLLQKLYAGSASIAYAPADIAAHASR